MQTIFSILTICVWVNVVWGNLDSVLKCYNKLQEHSKVCWNRCVIQMKCDLAITLVKELLYMRCQKNNIYS
jgi:hypothetical protein